MGLAESDKVIVAIPHRVSAATWHIANTQMLEAVAGKTIYVDVNTREGGCDMDQLDGSYITISPGAKSCINVMEIRPVVSPIAEYLDEQDSYEQRSWLTQKASQLLTFFHILIPDLTNEEEQLVDEAIIKTYNEFGITHKNDSVYIPGTKTLKTMPIIGDLYEVLRQNDDTHRVANILGRFVTGSASSFNHQTNVDLNNKFIVFDLEDLQGTMKAVGMFVCMDYLWSRIKENRTERKAILMKSRMSSRDQEDIRLKPIFLQDHCWREENEILPEGSASRAQGHQAGVCLVHPGSC